MPTWLIAVDLAVVVGAGSALFFIGRALERRTAANLRGSAEQIAQRLLEEARRDAEASRASLILSAKEELAKAREASEADAVRRREELAGHERRLEERDRQLDRKVEIAERRERDLAEKSAEVTARQGRLALRETELTTLLADQQRRLEAVAGMSAVQAKQELLRGIEDATRAEAANLVRTIKEQARRDADREARKIVALAIQRIAAEQTSESTVASVTLPSDEMKGRIIGREGRNIRAFETATGVDVIIDDTPDAVTLSCFDPIRREVAKIALEKLIGDGRIHPGRIEELVKKAQVEVDRQIVEAGEQAAYDVGVHGLHPELVRLVGRMRFRTSYGQNLLKHVKEVCWIAGIMATELKLDAVTARRGALLHDIGKVLTHEHEGTHVQLGVEQARKYGENATVINCIEAHHDDVPHESALSVIVQAADAVSAARPGARREQYESYIKRLTRLEEIATSFPGVEKSFAIQAGREVRVVVTPDAVNDEQAQALSDEIARRIEDELQYPGQIKIVVIRETRAVEYAK